MPYRDWLSVPAIVAWQLERVFPGRKVSVDMLAMGGANLAQVYGHLARLTHRPDAILVFSGHNEFQILVTWDRYVPYYVDDNPPGVWDRLEELGAVPRWDCSRGCACETAGQSAPRHPGSRARSSTSPLSRRVNRRGRSMTTLAGSTRLRRTHGRSEHCRSSSFPPATKQTTSQTARRSRLARTRAAPVVPPTVLRSSRWRDRRPGAGDCPHRAPIEAQPGFAESHFRLARLLARSGDIAAVRRHFSLAENLDGMPQRCLSSFQDACRSAARRHDCVLVDGPAILRVLVPDGILDDRLFHDAHHLTLVGYIALSQEVLAPAPRAAGVRVAGRGTGPPVIDVDEVQRILELARPSGPKFVGNRARGTTSMRIFDSIRLLV